MSPFSPLLAMSWVDLFPRGTEAKYDVEQQLLQSKFAEFLQKKLDISKNHMKIEVLLEYALAFFLYPHYTGEVSSSTPNLLLFAGKDGKDANMAWIEAVIRPRLLENRQENVLTLFNERFAGENEEVLNPTEIWHHIITILSERYTIPDAAVSTLDTSNKKLSASLLQYSTAADSEVTLLKKVDPKKEKTVIETLQLLMTLFVLPDIKLDSFDPDMNIAWANYWFHINKNVAQPVQDLRYRLIVKSKLQYIHPDVLKLVLNEIRGINASDAM